MIFLAGLQQATAVAGGGRDRHGLGERKLAARSRLPLMRGSHAAPGTRTAALSDAATPCLDGHGEIVDSAGWDTRYRASDLVWSGEPDRFVAAELTGTPLGRALDIGAGEGRNRCRG